MKIAIVDDSIKDREYLQKEIQEIFFRRTKNHIEITTFKSGEELLEYFYDNKEGNALLFDIVFLDIYMEDITGVDTARAIRKIDEDVKLIFITTSNEFASESYEVKAEDYLIKPFNKERLEKTLERLVIKKKKEDKILKFSENKVVHVDSIVYTKNRICLKGAVQCESAPLLNVIKFLLFLLCQEICSLSSWCDRLQIRALHRQLF